MKKKYWLLIILVLIVLLPFIKPAYNSIKLNWRIREALSFPSDGYISDHPFIACNTTIELKKESMHKDKCKMSIKVENEIINKGSQLLKCVIGAIKLTPRVNRYMFFDSIDIVMLSPVDLPPKEQSNSNRTIFGRGTFTKALTKLKQEEIRKLLYEPVLVKIVHDDGIVLLKVKPTIIIE